MHIVWKYVLQLRNVTFLLPRNTSFVLLHGDLFPSPSPGNLFSVPVAVLFQGVVSVESHRVQPIERLFHLGQHL